MKKLLGAAMALALAFPWPASAELLKNLKVGGELDIQANDARNIRDFDTHSTVNDRVGDATTRVMLNGRWDLLDDVHATVSVVKNDRSWGNAGGGGQAGAASGGGAGSQTFGAGGVQGNIYVQQANVKIDKLAGHFDTTLGRQWYGDPGDLIIYFGPKNNYGLFVTAIDAARVDAANDWLNFSGLAGKITGGNVGTVGNGDVDLQGFDIGWKNLPVKANTYVWNAVTHGTGSLGSNAGKNDFLYVYGLKVKGEAMGGWASAEFAHNSGECRASGNCAGVQTSNYEGSAFKADLGYKADVANVAAFTPWANFGWGSGRSSNTERVNDGFMAIASDYRPGIINSRFNAVSALDMTVNGAGSTSVSTNGLSNRVVYGAGLKATPAALEKLTLAASWWDYRFQRHTNATGATTASVGNNHIGYEYGLTADWKHSDNVSVGVGVADFQPGGFIKESHKNLGAANRETSPIQFAFADFTIKFE